MKAIPTGLSNGPNGNRVLVYVDEQISALGIGRTKNLACLPCMKRRRSFSVPFTNCDVGDICNVGSSMLPTLDEIIAKAP